MPAATCRVRWQSRCGRGRSSLATSAGDVALGDQQTGHLELFELRVLGPGSAVEEWSGQRPDHVPVVAVRLLLGLPDLDHLEAVLNGSTDVNEQAWNVVSPALEHLLVHHVIDGDWS